MERMRRHTESRLLRQLNTYINEDEIAASISQLQADIARIERTTGPSQRTAIMKREILLLEQKLLYSQEQGRLHTLEFQHNNPPLTR